MYIFKFAKAFHLNKITKFFIILFNQTFKVFEILKVLSLYIYFITLYFGTNVFITVQAIK
jgi:hypothetical protein